MRKLTQPRAAQDAGHAHLNRILRSYNVSFRIDYTSSIPI